MNAIFLSRRLAFRNCRLREGCQRSTISYWLLITVTTGALALGAVLVSVHISPCMGLGLASMLRRIERNISRPYPGRDCS
jgi:hypothetical protein